MSSISLNPKDYPSGYFSEYSGNTLFNVSVAFIVLEIFFVVLRLFARRLSNTKLGLDDVFIYPALLANLAECSLTIAAIYVGGAGRHLPEVLATSGPQTLVGWAKNVYGQIITYSLAVALSKLAIAGFYLRIFVDRRYQIATYVVAGVIIASAVANILVSIFQCTPVARFWDKNIDGVCIDQIAFYIFCSLPNIITDIALILLPIPMIWKLHTNGRQKAGLLLTFLTGGVGLISSCVRIAMYSAHDALEDNTWSAVTLGEWAVIEAGMYLIAACLPSLRPLLVQAVQRSPLTRRTSKMGYSGGLSGYTSRSTKHVGGPKSFHNKLGQFSRLGGSGGSGGSDNSGTKSMQSLGDDKDAIISKHGPMMDQYDIEMGRGSQTDSEIPPGRIGVKHEVHVV